MLRKEDSFFFAPISREAIEKWAKRYALIISLTTSLTEGEVDELVDRCRAALLAYYRIKGNEDEAQQ